MNKKNIKKNRKRILKNQMIFLEDRGTIIYFDTGESPMFDLGKVKPFLMLGSQLTIKQFIRGTIKGKVIEIKRNKRTRFWEVLVQVKSINRRKCLEI